MTIASMQQQFLGAQVVTGDGTVIFVPKLRNHAMFCTTYRQISDNNNSSSTTKHNILGVQGIPTFVDLYFSITTPSGATVFPFAENMFLRLPFGVAAESMHGVFLGDCKSLLDRISDSTNHTQPFYLSPDKQQQMNAIIANQRLPSIIQSQISEKGVFGKGAHLKAKDYRCLFIYFFGVWSHLLAMEDFSVFKEFIDIFATISSTNISRAAIPKLLERALILQLNIQQRYGILFMSSNIHDIPHSVQGVDYLGPIWATDTFGSEGCNHTLSTMISGTWRFEENMLDMFQTYQLVGLMKDSIENPALQKILAKTGGQDAANRANKKQQIASAVGNTVLVLEHMRP